MDRPCVRKFTPEIRGARAIWNNTFMVRCRHSPSTGFFALSAITIYHNPRCSKSRQTLALLEEHGVQPNVVRYLETPPSASDLAGLLHKLGITAAQLVRQGEDEYKTCGLSKSSSDKDLIAAMAKHPKLIERPIVVRGNKAVLGRPPENVLELID
jgi:arsenate reductase (glutaredoxin)